MLQPSAHISSTDFLEGFCRHLDRQTFYRFGNFKFCVKEDILPSYSGKIFSCLLSFCCVLFVCSFNPCDC